MERELVDSTNLASIGYESDTGTVEVEFRSNGQVWQYFDVPETLYYELRAEGSLGRAFNSIIKGHFREERVG